MQNHFRALTLVALVLTLTVWGFTARAWWTEGHQICTRAAVSKMPDDVPEFFRKGAVELAEASAEPDNWKHITAPHLKASEGPEHYIDLEYLEGTPLPAQRYDLIKFYVSKNVDLSKGGFLPYAIQEGYEKLMLAFRDYRNHPDAPAVRQRVLLYAGLLAHYCEDASMPLHTTKLFDGKPGPNGEPPLPPKKGIHARIDAYPEKNLTAEVLAENQKAESAPTVWPQVIKAIETSHTFVEKCYELDEQGAFEKEPAKAKEFMLERARAGVKLSMDVWYSAWVNSEKIVIKEK